MKTLETKLTCIRQDDYVEIEIKDDASNNIILRTKMTPDSFYKAFCQNRCMIDSETILNKDENFGLQMHHEKMEFETKAIGYGSELRDTAILEITELCKKRSEDEGIKYTPDNYFNAQDSFFTKDGVSYARCTVRWYK
jgi:hypothetical protein